MLHATSLHASVQILCKWPSICKVCVLLVLYLPKATKVVYRDHRLTYRIIYIQCTYYSTVSAQQTNLLPKNASLNDTIFAQKVYQIYATTSRNT